MEKSTDKKQVWVDPYGRFTIGDVVIVMVEGRVERRMICGRVNGTHYLVTPGEWQQKNSVHEMEMVACDLVAKWNENPLKGASRGGKG